MERCVLMKRAMAMARNCPAQIAFRRSPTRLPSSSPSSSSPSSPSSRRAVRVLALANSEDIGFQWKPVFRFEQADLMADAPSLLKTCKDFDWQTRANELRELAKLSLNTSISKGQLPESQDVSESSSNGSGDTWFAAGLALATAALVQCSFHFSALAVEEAIEKSEAAEAASRAPAWLTPALLAFPVISYAIFNVYRDQVNPHAKVTDWMFGVAAVVIIANLVLISTLGVRLY